MNSFDDVKAAFEAAKASEKLFDMVILESPTNPRICITDIKRIADIAHQENENCLVMVDNSIMTPLYQKPLELGADIAMCSATKFAGNAYPLRVSSLYVLILQQKLVSPFIPIDTFLYDCQVGMVTLRVEF